MQRLGTIYEAKEKVFQDARLCMDRIRSIAGTHFDTSEDAVRLLKRVRSETYEDLNQIQHEHLIICAAEWLFVHGICAPETQWSWNPRQTGDESEPDLAGVFRGRRVVSAEITTSERPVGIIDTRMRRTLEKLKAQPGELFYFVSSKPMESRAWTKVRKSGWNIRVVRLP